jgi:hypothetical protein
MVVITAAIFHKKAFSSRCFTFPSTHPAFLLFNVIFSSAIVPDDGLPSKVEASSSPPSAGQTTTCTDR